MYTIRKINKMDIEVIVPLYIDYFNSTGDNWSTITAKKRLMNMYDTPDSLGLICEENNIIMGFLIGHMVQFDDGAYYFIDELLVFKAYQRKHVGSILLSKSEEWMKKIDCKAIYLNSLNSNEHEAFYGSNGYKVKENLVYRYKRLS